MEHTKESFGVYCGRFNPIHAGHEVVINKMLCTFGFHRSLLIIGSANTPQSLRHFFSYEERRALIKKLFPDLKVVGLGDFNTSDAEWMLALDDLLISAGTDPLKATFFGGCEEDVSFFYRFDRKCQLLNRFDGTTPKISATEVRDALIHNRSLDGLVNPDIQEIVRANFGIRWEEFKRK